MRPAGLKSLVFGALALFAAGVLPGCENPLDPLDKSDKIEGLTYIEAQTTWEAWDSDPEADGVMVSLTYNNEFGDSLEFHDKSHEVVIEFWTQQEISTGETTTRLAQDELFFSKTIKFSNSEDDIRIPIEAYSDLIPLAAFDEGGEANNVFVIVRVFPPQEYPRTELYVAEADVVIFQPIEAEGVPNL